MTDQPVDDKVNIGTAMQLLGNEKGTLIACCPRDGEPLVFTMEWKGAEFLCVVCDTKYGFLSPTPKPSTPELEARLTALTAEYEVARENRAANIGRDR